MADVFISYARADRDRAAPLVAAIKGAGWSVWWDPEIAPGQEFDGRIEAELEAARVVVVIWTPTSVTSRWVRGEARFGADRGILVPVRFDEAALPIDVRAIYTTDLDGWAEDPDAPQLQEVLRALTAILSGSADAGPASQAGTGAGGAGRRIATPAPAAAATSATTATPSSAAAAVTTAAAVAGQRVAICVLPFSNMSGDPEQEYFSDGITEDIITGLGKVSALAVASRNSAFMYKGQRVDIPRVAQALKVSHILEGSVRKADNRVRIAAHLVSGATNGHLWGEKYDRALDDIFAVQDEISGAIVKALKVTLLPREKRALQQRGTSNIEAYNLYLMARHLYVTSHEGDSRHAEGIVRLCGRATAIDPGYGRAWALMALGQMILRFLHGARYDDGLAAAERALSLDPSLAEAHAVRARIFSEDGRYDAASGEIDRALGLDPESYEVNRSAAYLRYRQHRPQESALYFEKAMTLVKTDVNSASMLVSCYTALGDAAAVARVARIVLSRAERVLSHDPDNAAALAYGADAYASLGDAARAKDWMSRALLIEPDNIKTRYNFACTLAAQLHEKEAALDMLGPVFAQSALGLLNHAKADPDLDSIRDDPRFAAMLTDALARVGAADSGGAGSCP
jgi:adenylate cyclase